MNLATRGHTPGQTPGADAFEARSLAVRSIDVEKRTVDVVASTETLDAHGTIIVQDWDLARFQRNPVVLWAHNATLGMDELPIGRATRAEVVGGQLEATLQFAGADVSERAEQVFQALRQGFLRAVSVGFCPRSYRWEERDGREVLVLFNNELLEISCVPVGSNPDALARSLRNPATPEPTAGKDDPTMTEEEKRLLEIARRMLAALGTTDPTAAEATLRGLLDARASSEKNVETLTAKVTELEGALNEKRRAEVIDGAIREGRLAPRAEWTEEQRTFIEGLSPMGASVNGAVQRSPLEAYVSTLGRRVPADPPKTPKNTPEPAPRAAPTAPASRAIGGSYVERAAAEKAARRAQFPMPTSTREES